MQVVVFNAWIARDWLIDNSVAFDPGGIFDGRAAINCKNASVKLLNQSSVRQFGEYQLLCLDIGCFLCGGQSVQTGNLAQFAAQFFSAAHGLRLKASAPTGRLINPELPRLAAVRAVVIRVAARCRFRVAELVSDQPSVKPYFAVAFLRLCAGLRRSFLLWRVRRWQYFFCQFV